MARVVEGGAGAMNALIYGDVHPSVSSYIQDAYHRVDSVLNDVGRVVMDNAQRLYDSTRSTSAYRLAQAALRKLNDGFMQDTIQPLLTISQLQNAPSIMVPWLMSEPDVKQRFLKGRCEGYGDEYIDIAKGAIGQADPLWRAVHHGILCTDDDRSAQHDADVAAEPNWGCMQYWDDDVEKLNLTFEKQASILDSQDALWCAVNHGVDDPTSRWNASL